MQRGAAVNLQSSSSESALLQSGPTLELTTSNTPDFNTVNRKFKVLHESAVNKVLFVSQIQDISVETEDNKEKKSAKDALLLWCQMKSAG